jgi:DNA end-binding protein Ku
LLDMASMLIERKAGEFNPAEFHNRYVDALKELIEEKQKKKGEKVIQDPDADKPPPRGSNVIDLMAALKKSLGDEKRAKAGKAEPKKAPAKRTAAKKATKEPARKRA